jgi:phosphoenolpyruvate-protein phosphotransferase (PTS system enzyme I)
MDGSEKRTSRPSASERSLPPTSSDRRPPVVVEGIAGSPGLAIARALVIDTRRPGVSHRRVAKHHAEEELARFDAAVQVAAHGLRDVAEKLRQRATRAEASILEAYVLMVEDDSLREDVERRIRIDLQCAEWALDNTVRDMSQQLAGAHDPYLAERSHDFEFVGDTILRALSGKQRSLAVHQLEEPCVIVAHDLSPAETAGLTREKVKALVTEVGTRTSHTAILARALEIPAVVGVRNVLSIVGNGDVLFVDGIRGRTTISPSDDMIRGADARIARLKRIAQGLLEARDQPAATRCGVPIDVRANIELPQEANIAIEQGARGIGLYRTEFLYVDRSEPPSEEEQYAVYRRVLETVAPLPVTLRTFDIGGDKFVSTFQAPPDMNPALGLRAVRLGLARPEIFLEQFRAMVRASAHGDLRIMVPMIAAISELRAVRDLFEQAVLDVDRAGYRRAAEIPLGVMIEVPSAAIMAEEFAREAEFLSIGTNDLVQYALAVDRTNRELAYLASPFDPAILRLIRHVLDAGARHSRPVSVCGTMASDPLAAVLLLGMGVRELSLEASAIPKVKAAVSRVTLAEASTLAERAMQLVIADDVEQLVAEMFAPRLAELLDEDIDGVTGVFESP